MEHLHKDIRRFIIDRYCNSPKDRCDAVIKELKNIFKCEDRLLCECDIMLLGRNSFLLNVNQHNIHEKPLVSHILRHCYNGMKYKQLFISSRVYNYDDWTIDDEPDTMLLDDRPDEHMMELNYEFYSMKYTLNSSNFLKYIKNISYEQSIKAIEKCLYIRNSIQTVKYKNKKIRKLLNSIYNCIVNFISHNRNERKIEWIKVADNMGKVNISLSCLKRVFKRLKHLNERKSSACDDDDMDVLEYVE